MDDLDHGAAPLHQRFTLKVRLDALGVDDSIPWILVGRDGVEPTLLKAMPHLRGFSAQDLYRR